MASLGSRLLSIQKSLLDASGPVRRYGTSDEKAAYACALNDLGRLVQQGVPCPQTDFVL